MVFQVGIWATETDFNEHKRIEAVMVKVGENPICGIRAKAKRLNRVKDSLGSFNAAGAGSLVAVT
jgi:hypothetical protein